MDLQFTPEEQAFREEVRAFIREKLPPEIQAKVKGGRKLTKEDIVRWHKILNEKGWFALHWPKEWGGTGWTPVQRHIFDEEMSKAGAPGIVPFGVGMVAPVILKFGTEEQKQYYLPRILNQDDWWAQGYSEPGAGSDLASLKMRAEREGDYYILNGQKTWTTLGHYANMIFCLVRTNPDAPKRQEGISFLLVDMDTPGITVRPIITIEGGHEVNEVFFDNVKVPVKNRVGEENKGWTCAKYLLTYERTGIAGIGHAKTALNHLKDVAQRQTENGKPLIENPVFRAQIAQLEVELQALEYTNLRVLMSVQGGGVPGAESSILKIRGTEVRQAIGDLTRRAVGPYAMPFFDESFDDDPVGPDYAWPQAPQYFNRRKISIFGGSNEIQKNIISKAILGL